MSAILDEVLKQVEENYCCQCRMLPGVLCEMHSIINFIRRKHKSMMSGNFDVEEFYIGNNQYSMFKDDLDEG